MIDKKSQFVATFLVSVGLFACSLAQLSLAQDATDTPATSPSSVIAVSDAAALEANKDKDVTIEGVVREAAWSSSGKVMNVTFESTDETHLAAVVFSKSRATLDEAFNGDAAKAWAGATLRIKGRLRTYGGKVEGRKGQPEITISDASQVTIVASAATQPATQPAADDR